MIDPSETARLTNPAMVDFKLSDRDRGILNAFVQQEAFDIVQKLMLNAIREFHYNLMNTPVTDKEQVLAKHAIAQDAQLFYQSFMTRLNDELNLHKYNAIRLGTADNPEIAEVTPDFQ